MCLSVHAGGVGGSGTVPFGPYPPLPLKDRTLLSVLLASERYASYWYAVLFGKLLIENFMKMKEFVPSEGERLPWIRH